MRGHDMIWRSSAASTEVAEHLLQPSKPKDIQVVSPHMVTQHNVSVADFVWCPGFLYM